MTAAGRQLIAPRKSILFQAAARGELPFRFGGQALARLARELGGIVPGNVRDGIIVARCDIRIGSFGMCPRSAVDLAPPGRGERGIIHQRGAALLRNVSLKNEGPSKRSASVT